MIEVSEYIRHLYPAGKFICACCSRPNLDGESFRYINLRKFCPECYDANADTTK